MRKTKGKCWLEELIPQNLVKTKVSRTLLSSLITKQVKKNKYKMLAISWKKLILSKKKYRCKKGKDKLEQLDVGRFVAHLRC